MATYEYRCPHGHTVEHVQSMVDDVPRYVFCTTCRDDAIAAGADRPMTIARRVFHAPAAIHFKGPGFYATDVKSRVERRRRPNPGDDLPVEHDRFAERIANHA